MSSYEKFLQLMMEKSGEQRMNMGFKMYEIARKLVVASIPAPEGSSEFVDLFLHRFYGKDLTDSVKNKFLASSRNRCME